MIILELEYNLINQSKIVEGKIQVDKSVGNFLSLFKGQLDSLLDLLLSIVRFLDHQVEKGLSANKKLEKIVEIGQILKIQEALNKLQMM